MRKHLLLLAACCATTFTASAQSKGVKIGYIDMEYILENVSDYKDAKAQLEQKAQKWKQEIDTKNNEIKKLKENLKTEKVLLTKELIEEKEEEIAFQEAELLAYQDKRFGPTGDLIVQKAVLVKPIQDQVFTAVQDIAETRRYDFILDKSSDLTLLFAAKKFNISDMVVRALTRAGKRSQLSKVELKELEKKEYQEDLEDESSEHAERKKALDDKKAARQKLLDDRKAEREKIFQDRKDAQEARRNKLKADAEAKKNKTTSSNEKPSEEKEIKSDEKSDTKTTTEAKEASKPEPTAADVKKEELEQRKKDLEEKKAKVLAEREANRKALKEKQEADRKAREDQKNNK